MLHKLRNKISEFEVFIKELQDENKIIGLSVAFVYDDNIIYHKGFGKSRLNPERDITSDTIMSIQSITKSFVASSIMHLRECGLINLADPIVKYLPYFRTTNKDISDTITVKQLLSHTAGFPNNVEIANLICPNRKEFKDNVWQNKVEEYQTAIDSVTTLEDITRYFSNVVLDYSPGEEWEYCTDAYAIVGDLFEKVSGQTWIKYIEENIFKPIGMDRTTLDPSRAKEDEDSSRYYFEYDKQIEKAPYPTNPVAAPIGFIYSTAKDLAKYLAAHMEYGYSPILKSRSIADMQNPIGKIPKEFHDKLDNLKDTGYGLGWFIGKYKDFKIVEHGGGYTGIRTHVSMVPCRKLGIVALSNYDETNTMHICRKAIDIFLES